jgi:hypothetical protein
MSAMSPQFQHGLIRSGSGTPDPMPRFMIPRTANCNGGALVSLGASAGNSLRESASGIGTERAPSGLARFFGTAAIQDRM